MSKWAFKKDGYVVEAKALEIKENGKSVGWVDPDMVVAWQRGLASDGELVAEAKKQPDPPSKPEGWDKKLYKVKGGK